MTQGDINYLLTLSYALDHLPRKSKPGGRVISPDELDRLRIQEKTDNLYIVISEKKLYQVADDLRELAMRNEARVSRAEVPSGRKARN
jgi:hypothetical protein